MRGCTCLPQRRIHQLLLLRPFFLSWHDKTSLVRNLVAEQFWAPHSYIKTICIVAPRWSQIKCLRGILAVTWTQLGQEEGCVAAKYSIHGACYVVFPPGLTGILRVIWEGILQTAPELVCVYLCVRVPACLSIFMGREWKSFIVPWKVPWVYLVP